MSKLDPAPLPPPRLPAAYLLAALAIWAAAIASLLLPPAPSGHSRYAALGCGLIHPSRLAGEGGPRTRSDERSR